MALISSTAPMAHSALSAANAPSFTCKYTGRYTVYGAGSVVKAPLSTLRASVSDRLTSRTISGIRKALVEDGGVQIRPRPACAMASRVCRTSARSSGKKVKVMSMASVSTRGRRIQEKPRTRQTGASPRPGMAATHSASIRAAAAVVWAASREMA